MRRGIRTMALLLLLGVSTNLLLAWLCVLLNGERLHRAMSVQDAEAAAIGWLWPVANTWPEPNRANRFTAFGFEQLNVACEEPVPPAMMSPGMHPWWSPHSTTRERAGIPFLAFEARSIVPQSPAELAQIQGGLWSRMAWHYDHGYWVSFRNSLTCTLPLRPVWPGFALNCLIFSIGWALVLPVPRKLRCQRRRSLQLCVNCRYSVKGLDRCPECGTEVHRKPT